MERPQLLMLPSDQYGRVLHRPTSVFGQLKRHICCNFFSFLSIDTFSRFALVQSHHLQFFLQYLLCPVQPGPLDNHQGAAFDERPAPRVPNQKGERSFGFNS